MKARALIALGLTGLPVAAITAPAGAAKKAKATVVAKDAEGDWGDGTIPAEVGSALGMDLVGAEISDSSAPITRQGSTRCSSRAPSRSRSNTGSQRKRKG